MSVLCPQGHRSVATDYCDTCGSPIPPAAAPSATSAPTPDALVAPPNQDRAQEIVCPHCGNREAPGISFCEECGQDLVTAGGSYPPPAFVAEIWVDPDWYALQQPSQSCPSLGLPRVRSLASMRVAIGRASSNHGAQPAIDLSADPGVSRNHAELTGDGQRWFIEDLDSSNGTFVGPAIGPLPGHPIPVRTRQEVAPDERIYVGAWTRLAIRPGLPGEI